MPRFAVRQSARQDYAQNRKAVSILRMKPPRPADTIRTDFLTHPAFSEVSIPMPSGSQPPGRVLVTGASGFVGSAIAAALRDAGHPVRVLVRASSPRINIDPRDEVVVGDILDRASVATAIRGVRHLIHAAADYRLWAPSADDLIRANVEGTRIVMEEALRAGRVASVSRAGFQWPASDLRDNFPTWRIDREPATSRRAWSGGGRAPAPSGARRTIRS